MLKLIEQFTIPGAGSVEIFQTHHTGPDYHVRYGLQVADFDTLHEALAGFSNCAKHLRECAGHYID